MIEGQNTVYTHTVIRVMGSPHQCAILPYVRSQGFTAQSRTCSWKELAVDSGGSRPSRKPGSVAITVMVYVPGSSGTPERVRLAWSKRSQPMRRSAGGSDGGAAASPGGGPGGRGSSALAAVAEATAVRTWPAALVARGTWYVRRWALIVPSLCVSRKVSSGSLCEKREPRATLMSCNGRWSAGAVLTWLGSSQSTTPPPPV
mmetsp:Transcript_12529/g.28584  ORF Transcript_12529/g.28584 Transcript_12529/m.28584 type:complete len:202 (+) Transcript_12529:127-732(+)